MSESYPCQPVLQKQGSGGFFGFTVPEEEEEGRKSEGRIEDDVATLLRLLNALENRITPEQKQEVQQHANPIDDGWQVKPAAVLQ